MQSRSKDCLSSVIRFAEQMVRPISYAYIESSGSINVILPRRKDQ